jgi:peptidyl-prolyl cis-trans isomerase B (cyclophilin B)
MWIVGFLITIVVAGCIYISRDKPLASNAPATPAPPASPEPATVQRTSGTNETLERNNPLSQDLEAVIETNKGKINITLFASKTPITVANFTNLAKRGYYDGLAFHRVIEDFMVQGGCPLGTGTGSPGYQFGDEFVTELKHDKPGILSMANSGPATNGSQFFITHVPTPWLDGKHTVFGAVKSDADQEVINAINKGDNIISVTIVGDTADIEKLAESQLTNWNKTLDSKYPAK